MRCLLLPALLSRAGPVLSCAWPLLSSVAPVYGNGPGPAGLCESARWRTAFPVAGGGLVHGGHAGRVLHRLGWWVPGQLGMGHSQLARFPPSRQHLHCGGAAAWLHVGPEAHAQGLPCLHVGSAGALRWLHVGPARGLCWLRWAQGQGAPPVTGLPRG